MNILKFDDKKDFLIFLVGCFSTFYVSLIGRVYVGELLVFIFYLKYPEIIQIRLPKEVRRLVKMMCIWLISAIISDIYRQTPLIDCLKGITSILFLISLVPFVYWALHDKYSRWMYFFLGSIVSSQLTYYILTATTEFGSTEIWRVYSFVPLFSGIAILLYKAGKIKSSYLVFLLFGFWILYNGSRNIFLTFSMTVFLLITINRLKATDLIGRIKQYQKKIVVVCFTLIVGLFAIDFVYESLASNRYLGEKAYEKYYKQKNNSHGMISGRLESIMAAELIKESPFIGYGSFAKDMTNFVYNYYKNHDVEILPGRFDYDVDSVQNMLPRHSRIFGTWMWHGLGCGMFWIYILLLFYRVLKSGCLILEPKLLALSVFTLMTEVWDTFFSIMSVRLVPLFFWIFIILMYRKYKQFKDLTYYR